MMMTKHCLKPVICSLLAIFMCGSVLFGQSPTATPASNPDDKPSVKVGTLIFADYTWQDEPQVRDSDGNLVSSNSFNVSRAYVNFTGNLNHRISFRVTPDITREGGSGSSLNGSLTFRLKYAYGQYNLDDWTTKGSWIRLGMTQTPYIDFMETVYRYRFQGTVFVDREGYLIASDLGVGGRYVLPGGYGDIQSGIYNGEGYSKPEANDQKAWQTRFTLRPFPTAAGALSGLKATVFYDADHYVRDAERNRLAGALTFENKHANASVEFIDANDQTSAHVGEVDGRGYSVWVTPKFGHGVEALFRHDDLKPNTDIDARKKRDIAGVAYWFPNLEKVTSAVLLDYERVTFSDFVVAQPDQKRFAVHLLINF